MFTLDKNEINYAIEYSLVGMYNLKEEGLANFFKTENNHMLQIPGIDFYEFNRTAMTRLHEEEVDDAIKTMIDFYTQNGSTSFSWVIGPLTTPNNLGDYLKRNHFKHELTGWGMYMAIDKKLEIPKLDGLIIKELSIDDVTRELEKLIEEAYGMPEGSGEFMKQIWELISTFTKIIIYFAFDGSKPVAWSDLITIPNTKGVLMGGAGTLPEYRGRGIYGNMLKIRKEKAKELGAEFLVIQANENTSAPIAQKHGFEKICDLDFYVYKPKER